LIGTALSTFAIIFLAELPDKTSLAALALATRFRSRDVIIGAWLAFAVQTAIAVAAGSVIRLLPARPVHVAAGLGFLLFAVLALRRNEAEEAEEESEEAEVASRKRSRPWLATFLVIFAAELGDLTQLTTASLVATTRQPIPVAIGALIALWCVTLIAVVVGKQAGRYLSPIVLQRASAVLFSVVGLVVLAQALL
jgi:Ca2+/H+ antiporter, TMEM165/GDT1 family